MTTEKISTDADLALLKGNVSGPKIKEVAFAESDRSASAVGRSCFWDIPRGSMQFLLAAAKKQSGPLRLQPKASRKRWWKNLPGGT